MKRRCNNPLDEAYGIYGGRGITVCDRWQDSFANFFADMGKRPSRKHSLDRKDNDLGYTPDNCRWATPEQQNNNRRQNRLITLNGKTQTLTVWANELGLPPNLVFARIDNGWSAERSLTTPVRRSTLAKYSRESGLSATALRYRLEKGWTLEKAINSPRTFGGAHRKFSDEEIQAIRDFRPTHTIKQTIDRFGCSEPYLWRIMNGKARAHVS
jgi:hypothetical protein